VSWSAEVAERLAIALDQDDYETVASVLAEEVSYSIGEDVLVGREEVVGSYRAASEMARRLFDRVEYGHVVFATDDPDTFRISYSDRLTIGDESLTHMAEQHVTVAMEEAVTRIVNVELPGEREAVDAFLERHGLSRDS